MTEYKPISCSLYDHLELFALRGKTVELELKNGERFKSSITTIKARKNLGEFLILQNGREVRLDNLNTVNNILFNGQNC